MNNPKCRCVDNKAVMNNDIYFGDYKIKAKFLNSINYTLTTFYCMKEEWA